MSRQAPIKRHSKDSESAAAMAVLNKFIEARRAKMTKLQEQKRAEKEKDIFHKIRKAIFPKGDDEVLVYDSYIYRDPLVKVNKAYEERQEILALLDKFETWYARQPQKKGKTEADYLKEFLAMQNK